MAALWGEAPESRQPLRRLRLVLPVIFSAHGLMVLSFAFIIALGSVALSLPWCHAAAKVSFLDALFTATSAVCVTGLAVVDTGTAWSPLGQVIILLLIQVGGLGVITFGVLFFQLVGQRLSLTNQAVMQETFLQRDAASEVRSIARQVFAQTAVLELVGVGLLFFALVGSRPVGHAFSSAVFHSVSAFCNAGFSIYSDNLVGLRDNPLFTAAVMLLIVSGGLGQMVLTELRRTAGLLIRREQAARPRWFSLHAQVVVWASLVLIVLGALGVFAFGLTPAEVSVGERVQAAVFQSVSARTAGFNTVDVGALPQATLVWIVLLMFIGGSPASCAGGVKTTTFVIWLAQVRAAVLRRPDVTLLGHRLPQGLVQQANLLMGLAVVWNTVGVLLLAATEAGRLGLHQVLFEQVSAFGTVGLSANATPFLSATGKLWIIATMFVGRLGPLTLTTWALRSRSGPTLPEGRVMIG